MTPDQGAEGGGESYGEVVHPTQLSQWQAHGDHAPDPWQVGTARINLRRNGRVTTIAARCWSN